MAQNLLFKYTLMYELPQYTTFGWIAGDFLYVYWDDSTLAIVVKRSSNTETSGSNIGILCDSGQYEAVSAGWFTSWAPNYLQNPDVQSFLSRSSVYAAAGTYSAKYIQPNTTNDYIAVQVAPLVSGKNYRVSCYVKGDITAPISTNPATTYLYLAPDYRLASDIIVNNEAIYTLSNCHAAAKKISCDIHVVYASSSIQYPMYLRIKGWNALATSDFLYIDKFEIIEITGFTTSVSTITSGADLGNQSIADTRGRLNRTPTNWILDESNITIDSVVSGEYQQIITSKHSYCDSTTLVNFVTSKLNPQFPYAIKSLLAGAPICAVVPITCNIRFIGTPIVVNTTNLYKNDGYFLVVAASSYGGVKYALSTEIFNNVYDHTQWTNTTGLFTLLTRGYYRVYAIDAVNCYTYIDVSVLATITNDPIDSVIPDTHGVKYRFDYVDLINGDAGRVDILERNYLGSITDVTPGESPFVKNLNSQSLNNKFEVIRPTNATVRIASIRDFQFMGLFSQDDRKYQVRHQKPVGTVTWIGYVIPSVFTQPYNRYPPYIVEINASDGITELSNLDFVDKSGNRLTGNYTLISIVQTIVSKLDLNIGIRVACNINEVDQRTTSSTCFEDTYVSTDGFLDEDDKPWNCERVLISILLPFGAKIVQENGYWNIIRIEEQYSSYNYRQYTSEGVYSSSSSYNPIIDIIDNSALALSSVFTNNDAVMSVVPSYGNIKVVRKLNPVVKNLVVNGSFDIEKLVNGVIEGWNIGFSGIGFTWGINTVVDIIPKSRLSLNKETTVRDSSNTRTYQLQNKPSYINNFTKKSSANVADTSEYALGLYGLNNVGSYALVTSKSIGFELGANDSFVFSFEYRVNIDVTGSYRGLVNPLWVKIGWSITFGDYYWNISEGWTTNSSFKYNFIFVDTFNKLQTFETNANFFSTTRSTLKSIKIEFKVFGSNGYDNGTSAGNVSALDKSIGHRICVKLGGTDYYWYTLITGTDATSSPDIVRPSDYSAVSGIWKLDEYTRGSGSKPVEATYLDNVNFNFLPKGKPAPSEQITSPTIISTNKENIDVILECGDLPTTIHSAKYIYDNYFKGVDGIPTALWTRSGISESSNLTTIFTKMFSTQYQYPTFSVTGSLFGFSNLNFLTTFKHSKTQASYTLVGEEFTGSITGWTNGVVKSGTSWTSNSNNARLTAVSAEGTTSASLTQTTLLSFKAGDRISISFKITRSSTVGVRDEWLYLAMAVGSYIVQELVIGEYSSNGIYIKNIKFTISQDCDNIGFYFKNINGNGTCIYDMEYFRLIGLIITRYFTLDSMEKDEVNNSYNVSLIQLVPMIASVDTTVDDSGSSNIGTESISGGANNSGNSFNGDFNNDFGADFDTILN